MTSFIGSIKGFQVKWQWWWAMHAIDSNIYKVNVHDFMKNLNISGMYNVWTGKKTWHETKWVMGGELSVSSLKLNHYEKRIQLISWLEIKSFYLK